MKINLVTTENAPMAVEALLLQVRKTYGFIPNTYGIMAQAPLAVAAYLELNRLVKEHSTLTPQEQQVVMLSVSAENGCEYCVAAHTVVATTVRMPEEAIRSLRDGTRLADARLDALAAFARALVRHRGWVPEAEREAFLAAGFTIGQVLEVVTITAMKTISNYANHLGDPPLDAAFASAAWKRPCER